MAHTHTQQLIWQQNSWQIFPESKRERKQKQMKCREMTTAETDEREGVSEINAYENWRHQSNEYNTNVCVHVLVNSTNDIKKMPE